MAIVLEIRRHLLEHAAALDEHVLVAIDQDVADRRVAQQRLERPEPEHVVQNLGEQRFALGEAERRLFLGEQLEQQRADLALGPGAIGLGERFEIQPVQQLAMNARPQLHVLVPRLADRLGRRPPNPAVIVAAARRSRAPEAREFTSRADAHRSTARSAARTGAK